MNNINTSKDTMEPRFGRHVVVNGHGTGRVAFVGQNLVKVMLDSGGMVWVFIDQIRVIE